MKPWIKKTLGLLLCLVMLMTMIPASFFTASGLTYSNSVFSIASVSDWNDIATYAKNNPEATFAGKTIRLTKNVDLGGSVATLFPNTFAGTFDGQGFTLSNFKATTALIANTTTGGAVIQNLNVNGNVSNPQDTMQTGMLIGKHDGTGSLTVKNCTVAGSASSVGMHFGGVIGILTLNDGQSAVLENINVSATMTDTREKTSQACVSSGGVVGIFEPFGRPTLEIRNVNMTGSITANAKSVGGIVGSVFTSDSYEDLYAGGTITISNCSMTGSLSAATTNTLTGLGGIVGTFGGFKRDFGEYSAFDGELNIDNCVVGGSLKNTCGLVQPMSVGGVLGAMSYSHATVNVDHCLIRASFPSQSLTASDGTGAGLILGTSGCQTMSALNVNNTATTIGSFNLIGSTFAKEGRNAAWIVLNGQNCSTVSANYPLDSWYYSGPITDSSVLTVSSEAAAAMVKNDENGFIQKVGGQISCVGVQDNVPDDATLTNADSYSLRFIAVTHVESAIEGRMNVIVRDANTGDAFKSFTTDAQLYDALRAYDDNGAVIKSYTAKDFGGKKFIALIIGNIPAGSSYIFEITPEYTTMNGIVVTGETVSVMYDKNGQYVKEKESLDVERFVGAEKVRVMSSNLLAADNSSGAVDLGISHEQRMANMAEMFLFYRPDFIGLQETSGSSVINNTATINMQATLLSYLNGAYAYVDVSDQVAAVNQWTPMLYRTDKWTVLAKDISDEQGVEYGNAMHRWQWALFQSKTDENTKMIVLNLHGPHGGDGTWFKDFQPTFFACVNAQIKKLESLYPNVPIAVTGDYNQLHDSTLLSAMIAGTHLENSAKLTGNAEKVSSGIDHVFVSKDKATVEQFREVDNMVMRQSSDHRSVFSDILLKKKSVPTIGSAMDWSDGVVIYDINSNTNVIKVLGERHLESNQTLYTDWTASGLEFYATMNSTSDIVFTANSTAPCYFKAYVDGTLWKNGGLDYYTVSGSTKVTLKSVPEGTHTVRLVKATGYLLGQAEISAVELNGTISATPSKDLYIEFLGDSISCGWGVVGTNDGAYTSQDGTLAYPYLVAQALNADYSILGLSGRGVVYGTDYNFDKNYLHASPARSTTAYGFERQADIVVINLGTNDRAYHADTAEFEAGYVRLLENVFAKNGSDCIVYCLWGAMNDTYNTQIQSAIATYRAAHSGAKIYTLELATSTTASGAPTWGHPSISDHAGYTTALTNALKSVIS
ncbi:MAG: hypothetical protein IJD64_05410 [Clostridia bacterium]|nr:hypothetical protein [Clostridia bacterium]